MARPYRLVMVAVTAPGSGRTASAASRTSGPCRSDLPIWPGSPREYGQPGIICALFFPRP